MGPVSGRWGRGEGALTCSRKVFSLSGTSSAVVLLTSTMEQQGTVSRGFEDWRTNQADR